MRFLILMLILIVDLEGDFMKKIVFMGTPLYSVPVLDMLNKNYDVVLVVTQPDKEVGRKKVLTPCPCKSYALEHGIDVFSPFKIKEDYERILSYEPDLIVTCAYGQIIPSEVIYAPLYDTINVHASLLPKYRGGAPIHRAIMNGDKETGVTIMYTDPGMDTGDIITSLSIPILDNDTYDIISSKLSVLGAELLSSVLPLVFSGEVTREVQGDDYSIARIIKREDEHIDFNMDSVLVHNKIRGLSSVPCAYANLDGKPVKIILSSLEGCLFTDKDYGTVTRTSKDGIFVSCKDKEIKITKIQVPGKKPVLVRDYLNGAGNIVGKRFE